MGAWLYQMNAEEWSPDKYRKSVREGKTLNWSVGRIYRRKRKEIAPGDQVVLFFCERLNAEPGIYGLGEVKRFTRDGDSGPRIRIAVRPRTDTLKSTPVWDSEVRATVQAIRGNLPRGTMWRVTPSQYERLRRKIQPRPSMDAVDHRIRAALMNLGKKRGSRPENTARVKNAVAQVAHDLGFTVYAAGCRRSDGGEWLFDLCWCKESDYAVLHDLPLALECEWGSDGALVDFQKLLISRADHRVFVCSQKNAEDWQDCVSQLISQIRHFDGTRNGDRYLFANWSVKGWDFKHYVHPGKIDEPPRVWLFQANLDEYELEDEIKPQRKVRWEVSRYFERLIAGDLVVLWQAGKRAGVYGLAELTSDAYEKDGGSWVDLRYVGLCEPPIFRKAGLTSHCVLRHLDVIRMPPAGNPFRVHDDEWKALKVRKPLKRLLQRLGK